MHKIAAWANSQHQCLSGSKGGIPLGKNAGFTLIIFDGKRTSLSRVGPYRFCSDGNPTALSILLWSYLTFSDTHIINHAPRYIILHL